MCDLFLLPGSILFLFISVRRLVSTHLKIETQEEKGKLCKAAKVEVMYEYDMYTIHYSTVHKFLDNLIAVIFLMHSLCI